MNDNEEDIKWITLPNSNDTAILKQHGFIDSIIKTRFGNYNGNKSLCGKIFVSNDGESALKFYEIENEGLKENQTCKLCLKKYFKKSPTN